MGFFKVGYLQNLVSLAGFSKVTNLSFNIGAALVSIENDVGRMDMSPATDWLGQDKTKKKFSVLLN